MFSERNNTFLKTDQTVKYIILYINRHLDLEIENSAVELCLVQVLKVFSYQIKIFLYSDIFFFFSVNNFCRSNSIFFISPSQAG